jgi:putative membrane protein insertion efficiency factor
MKEFVYALLAFAALCLPVQASEWGPWSVTPTAPVWTGPPQEKDATSFSHSDPPALFLLASIRFFQQVISPVDGDRCTMSPSCSHYGAQAIRKHGALIGFMMTADRIVHEYEEQRYVPAQWDGQSYRFLDPVENNDFWFGPSPSIRLPLQTGREE